MIGYPRPGILIAADAAEELARALYDAQSAAERALSEWQYGRPGRFYVIDRDDIPPAGWARLAQTTKLQYIGMARILLGEPAQNLTTPKILKARARNEAAAQERFRRRPRAS
jgi:hypothetical protein